MWDRGEHMGVSVFFSGSHWEKERWWPVFFCHVEPWGPVALSFTQFSPVHMNY